MSYEELFARADEAIKWAETAIFNAKVMSRIQKMGAERVVDVTDILFPVAQ
ncbi:MAG: hypothetical protein WCJ84_00550 [Candidatus Peregrinibacteria bacterium]